MFDEERENIQNMAISARGAKAEDFKDFLKSFDKKVKENTDEAHASNMGMLNQKL